MGYPVARPDVIRAINQRWLLKFWHRHLGEHRVPPWQSVEADSISHISTSLILLDVTGAAGAGPRFLIRFQGAAIAQAFGTGEARGKYLDEVIPPSRAAENLPPYQEAVAEGRPVYTIHDLTDREGRLVHYERLLLPFARDGLCVDRILGSFEFICPDGAFDGRGLIQTQNAPPALRFCATIESEPA